MRAIQKLAVAASLACAASPAIALPCEPPGWARVPSAEELTAVYPQAAAQSGVGGKAVLRCRSRPDGRMEDCAVESEEPAGYGFGAAALAVVHAVRGTRPCPGSPMLAPGGARVPIRFVPPPPGPPFRAAAFQQMAAYRRLGVAGPYYPDRAAQAGVTSVVIADCHVADTGRLDECKVVQVTNRDYGFEFAFLKMVERGWMTAAAPPPGVAPPQDGVWRFRVDFRPRDRTR